MAWFRRRGIEVKSLLITVLLLLPQLSWAELVKLELNLPETSYRVIRSNGKLWLLRKTLIEEKKEISDDFFSSIEGDITKLLWREKYNKDLSLVPQKCKKNISLAVRGDQKQICIEQKGKAASVWDAIFIAKRFEAIFKK